MIRSYFDSSALVKLTRDEPESQALIDYLDRPSLEASTSVLANVEVILALRRSEIGSDNALRGFYLVRVDDDILQEAARLGTRPLKALDAIHIATALAIASRNLEFVTYDDRQAEAARQAGLTVVQPGR